MIELCCECLSVRCVFTLKLVCDMIITYSPIHHKDKYSQQSSIWPNDWVFVYELSGCGSNLVAVTYTSDMAPASSKEFLYIQANYTVLIHAETRTWHDNKTQWNIVMFQQSLQSTCWILYSVRFMQMPEVIFFELGLSVSQWWFPKQNGFISLSLKSLSYILTSPYSLYLCLR